jgi:hypothetical protein
MTSSRVNTIRILFAACICVPTQHTTVIAAPNRLGGRSFRGLQHLPLDPSLLQKSAIADDADSLCTHYSGHHFCHALVGLGANGPTGQDDEE